MSACEPLNQEVKGKLDYVRDSSRFENGRLELFCLEISLETMLLLEQRGPNAEYARVGTAEAYRENFFAGTIVKELVLV